VTSSDPPGGGSTSTYRGPASITATALHLQFSPIWVADLPVNAPYRCLKNSSTDSKYHESSPSPTFLQSALSSSS